MHVRGTYVHLEGMSSVSLRTQKPAQQNGPVEIDRAASLWLVAFVTPTAGRPPVSAGR